MSEVERLQNFGGGVKIITESNLRKGDEKMTKVFDDDGIEYDVYYDEQIKINIFKKTYTDEKVAKEQEKRKEERVSKERRI